MLVPRVSAFSGGPVLRVGRINFSSRDWAFIIPSVKPKPVAPRVTPRSERISNAHAPLCSLCIQNTKGRISRKSNTRSVACFCSRRRAGSFLFAPQTPWLSSHILHRKVSPRWITMTMREWVHVSYVCVTQLWCAADSARLVFDENKHTHKLPSCRRQGLGDALPRRQETAAD